MKRFLILILLTGILPSILYSQTDSLKCFTPKQQNEIIQKLVQLHECKSENQKLIRIISDNEKIIENRESKINELNDKFELADYSYREQIKLTAEAEKQAKKEARRKQLYKLTTGVLAAVSAIFYFF